MINTRDVVLKAGEDKQLLLEKHEKYIKQYANDDHGTDQILAEYLKMSGMYWGVNALFLMQAFGDQPKQKVLDFIKACQNVDGGFGAAPRHDSHLLHTLSAVQVLVILDELKSDYIDADRCASYVKSLQQDNGCFFGDKWGEIDTRFSFCALATMKLLNKMDSIDVDKAVQFVASCRNEMDGGFGSKPGSESHSAYVYCCVGSLALTDRLDLVDIDQLAQWLSQRQLPSGGLNGRPEKLPDLCYSWWCLSSLKMIGNMHRIDHKRLINFILHCQDEEQGGFSDRPGNWVDPFHTMFGVASLSLMCHNKSDLKQTISDIGGDDVKLNELMDSIKKQLIPVNPILCMPQNSLTNVNNLSNNT